MELWGQKYISAANARPNHSTVPFPKGVPKSSQNMWNSMELQGLKYIITTRPCLYVICIIYRKIVHAHRTQKVNQQIQLCMTQRLSDFDLTMDLCCRILKKADAKKATPLIDKHFVHPTGGFKVLKFKDGKHVSLRCVEDLFELVKDDEELKAEMMRRDKTGILKGKGLKYYV